VSALGWVETMGLEPTTFWMQTRCSSQLSYVPDGRCEVIGAGRLQAIGQPELTRRLAERRSARPDSVLDAAPHMLLCSNPDDDEPGASSDRRRARR
jgi:hypothetical protein